MLRFVLVLALGTAFATAAATWAVLRWARHALLDQPNARSSHTVPTPRGGGLGLWVGILAGSGGWLLADGGAPVLPPETALLTVGIVTLVSFLDDLQPLPFRLRLIVQVAATVLLLWAIQPFDLVLVPLLGTYWAPVSGVLLSVLWCVGLTNAYNFLDGIDGLAAVQGLVAGLTWVAIGWALGNATLIAFAAIVAAACAAFLPFNWRPARIFLGDIGSATLGMLFATIPLIAKGHAGGMAWIPLAGALAVWPFLFDAAYTFARRLLSGENVFEAHRTHLYQRLVVSGWSHPETVRLYAGLAVANGLAAVGFAVGSVTAETVAVVTMAGTGSLLLGLVTLAERRAATRLSSAFTPVHGASPSGR